MYTAQIRLLQAIRQLPPQQLNEVIDFAEFLSLKATKENGRLPKGLPRARHFEISTIKDVKFIGNPLLRREDIYDEAGR